MKKAIIFGLLLAVVFTGCKKSEDEPETDPQKIGIVGEWYSSGTDVAPLLALYFNVDSIWAKFESNNTYTVKSYDVTGALTTYSGTYAQVKSGVGTIWNITLNQSVPSVAVAEGIFDISTATTPYSMQYEVVQTEPPAGTKPNAADGFGSTNGGQLGTINVQKYKKLAN